MSQFSKEKLKGKDLITIGIFSAIYFVTNFIFMLMGGLHPMMWILMPGFIALFTGLPFMLMCSKVQKMGAVLLMGAIIGLIYFVTGMFTAVILATFAISCILSELVRMISGYNNFKGNMLAFICFSLGMTGSPLPVWIMHDKFMTQISGQGMPADYIMELGNLSSPTMLLVLFLAPVIGAIIGSWISKKMFQKHFEKAGIV
ncbi:MptD family putative ECF transporter S component [Anaerocolumna sp.]|uniref:MptD family putative ECF transporter S component n=1 Tax=Anaerocolumna sp. TaxID=2041569 RepID=UPI0028B073FF|nr:MptD family putative ECF transporter S component [Anaerocolumna sp.]